jgi:hypothetical protein
MNYPLVKVPKPKCGAKKVRAPLRKTRMKSRNAKRKGSAFPKVRDAKYRRWIWTENECLLRAHPIRRRFSEHDMVWPNWNANPRDLIHVCWGAVTPAHVGEHQARGAPDFGVLVPLCEAAHRFYDTRRWDWRKATGYTERQMASEASGYALKYQERGGF